MAEIEEKERKQSNTYVDHDHLLLDNLPKEKGWFINDNDNGLNLYKGFWCTREMLTRIMSFNEQYKAEPSDILLVTLPKCGTTWLKALMFSITNRHHFSLSDSPLLRSNPHEVVTSFETDLDLNNPKSFLENLPHPRLISTHVPYRALPPSVTTSGCKIVSILRDPRDLFVSAWHFMDKGSSPELTIRPLEECFDLFCRGVYVFGPFWDHFLGSYDASQDRPDKILILRYEEMKVSPVEQTRKLACFLGFPFSEEEEKSGVVEEIVKLCSFDHLKGSKVNKEWRHAIGAPNNAFFRKGEVGDWNSYLTPSMNDRIQKLMNDKFRGSDLAFH